MNSTGYLSNFIFLVGKSITADKNSETSTQKGLLDQLASSDEEHELGEVGVLTKLCPLPKSILQEFPGGVINIGLLSDDIIISL